MEKKQRFSLRKTTMGLVSALIMGITVIPIFQHSALAQEGSTEAEEVSVIMETPPVQLHTTWTANTVAEIEQEIQAQLAEQTDNNHDYVIQWGDTVWGITQAFGLDQDLFVQVNGIENPDLIYADDVVTLNVENGTRPKQTQTGSEDVVVTPQEESTPEITETKAPANVVSEKSEPKPEPVSEEVVAPSSNDRVVEKPTQDEIAEIEDATDSGNFTNDLGNDNDSEPAEKEEDEIIEDIVEEPTEEKGEGEVTDEETIEESEDVVVPEDEDQSDGEIIDEEIVDETPETPVEDEQDEEEDGDQDVIVNRTIKRNIEIKHGVRYVEDDSIPAGEQEVIHEGSNGVRTEIYNQRVVNGEVESETLVDSSVTTEAVDRVVHIGTQKTVIKEETVTGSIAYKTIRRANSDLEKGVERVVREGKNGTYAQVFEVLYVNGVAQGDPGLISERVVTEPVDEIIEYGTKEAPIVEEDNEIDFSKVDTALFNQEMLKYVNQERALHGREALTYSSDLQRGTDARAEDLIEIEGLDVNGVGHVRPDGSDWRGAFTYLDEDDSYNRAFEVQYSLGENIAQTHIDMEIIEAVEAGERTLEDALAESIFNQYKRSPGHHSNMISASHKEMATATRMLDRGWYYEVYNVQIFDSNLSNLEMMTFN